MPRPKLLPLIQFAFFIATFWFIGSFFLRNWSTIQSLHIEYNWTMLTVSFILAVGSTFFHVLKNKQIYELELYAVRLPLLWKVVCRTNLYRYIPGGIWNHAGLVLDLSKETHITIGKSSKLQMLNIVLNVYVGLLFVVFVLPIQWMAPYLLLYVLGYLLLPQVLRVVRVIWNRISPRKFDLPQMPYRVLLRLALSNFGFWLLIGLSFVFFLKGINIFNSNNFALDLYLTASYVLAWVAGFLFIPAPNGLGIREVVMGFFLEQAHLSLAIGVSVSLLYRLFILVRDLVVFGVSLVIRD